MKSKTDSRADRAEEKARTKKWAPILTRHLKKPLSNLHWRWELGEILQNLRPPKIYNRRWIRSVLPEKFKVCPDLGSKAMAFRKAFTQEQVEMLTSFGTNWTAIVTVLAAPSADQMPLLQEAKENRWSIRELRLQVAKVLTVPRVQYREPVPPVSCGNEGDVYRLAQDVERWRCHTPLWKEAVESLLSDLDRARKGNKLQILLKLVEKAEEQLGGLRRDALQLKKALTALREKLKP